MWKRALCALLCVAYPTENYAKTMRQIRQIEADEAKVVGINTALGYSTIIEFQSKPISAVLGDQDAFKIEYVGNSITVKPLIPHAQSNLFVFTDYDRFNCTLRTGASSEVDYIVKISSPRRPDAISMEGSTSTAPPAIVRPKMRSINKTASFGGYTLKVVSIARMPERTEARTATIVEIELSSRKKSYQFSAGALGVRQKGRFIPIESLYLDSLILHPGNTPIHGKIVLLNQDLRSSVVFTIVFAVSTPLSSRKIHRLEVTLGNPVSKKKEPPNGKGK